MLGKLLSKTKPKEVTTLLQPPKHIEIVVHNYCNFKCKMCNVWKHKDPESIPMDSLYKTIDQLQAFKTKDLTIQFIGGETLLYKGLTKAITHASSYGYRVGVTTNGYMLNKEKVIELSKAGLSFINLSLDSIKKDTHNELRGVKNSYEKIMRAIVNFKIFAPHINLGINSVITNHNMNSIIELSRFTLIEPKVNTLYFIALDKPYESEYGDDWMYNSEVSDLWPKDKQIINQVFDSLIQEKKINLKIGNSITQLNSYKAYYLNPNNFIKKFGCKFGDSNLFINSYSQARLCVKRPDMDSIGNINDEHVFDIWHSKKSKEVRQKMNQCKLNCVQILSCDFEDE